MTRPIPLLPFFGLAAAAVLATASCGDNGVECGPNTTAVNGQCVAQDCGPGTVLAGDTCVPDGTVVCAQGTVFDAPTGTCVLDPDACAEGTTHVAGECIPDDDLLEGMADFIENVEPNGPGDANIAGMFDAPALDASTYFYGCVTATTDADNDGNLDADYDTWLVTAGAPMVLEITTDGIHGLSAGFIAVNADQSLATLLRNWQRIGINLAGDTAKREIFLPAAGTYALLVTDARSLFLGDAGAGNPDSCYFATVKHVATPTPVALTLPSTAGEDTGRVRLYTHTANGVGDILDVSQQTSDTAWSPAYVTLRNGALAASAASQSSSLGPIPPFDTIGGLNAGDVVTLVADAEYNFALAPQQYTFQLFDIDAQPLPTTGTPVLTVVERNGTTPTATYADFNYLYFDVATAGIKHFNLVASKPIDMLIVRRDLFTAEGGLDLIAEINALGGAGRALFQGEFVRFLTPGRYYFVARNPAVGVPGGTYTITSTVTDVTTTPITLGTAVDNQALALGNRFHTLDLTDPIWIELGVTATANWGVGSNVSLESYDLASSGWLRSGTPPTTIPAGNLFPAFGANQPAAAPFAPLGRILARDARDFLIRVRPTATPGTDPTYSLLVRNRPNVVNLGTLTAAPLARVITALAAGAPARFIAFAPQGTSMTALVHPGQLTVDLREVRVNANEVGIGTFDTTLAGGDETLAARFNVAPNDWVAWTVENKTPVLTSDVDLTVNAIIPRPYVVTAPTIAYADACVGGGVSLGDGLDDEVLFDTFPAALTGFPLFGEAPPTTFKVAANGWIAFDTTAVADPDPTLGFFDNRPIPTAGVPDGVVAPFWQDLQNLSLCRKAVGTTVTYQWVGHLWGSPAVRVQFQAIFHAGGVIDFVYGPMHAATGATPDTDDNGATIGVENLSGSFGQQLGFNQAIIAPGTARKLTPQ